MSFETKNIRNIALIGHGNNGRDCCADDICTAFSVTAVSGNGESGDSLILGEKFASCHS